MAELVTELREVRLALTRSRWPADRGLLDAAWETGARPGRPPRHLYRLTTAGLEFARGLAPAAAQARGRARLQEA
jgi:DNA-binding PadR family transcriptional regulator